MELKRGTGGQDTDGEEAENKPAEVGDNPPSFYEQDKARWEKKFQAAIHAREI